MSRSKARPFVAVKISHTDTHACTYALTHACTHTHTHTHTGVEENTTEMWVVFTERAWHTNGVNLLPLFLSTAANEWVGTV